MQLPAPYITMCDFGPSVDDQAVSLSDDGTTIIIDFSLSLLFSSFLFFSLSFFPSSVVFPEFFRSKLENMELSIQVT